MTPPIIRTLVSLSLNKSSHFRKPSSCYSISVIFFSSSTADQNPKPPFDFADHFIKKHNFSPEVASKAASSLNYLSKPNKCDRVLSFLRKRGFSESHIEEAVKKKPNLLAGSLKNSIKPIFKVFQDLGFSAADVADILSVDPWVLCRSADDRIAPSLSILKSILGSNEDVVKLLKTTTWFLKSDLEKNMVPNIEYLASCGISSSKMVKYVFTFPRFFLNKPESIKHWVERLDDMGFDRNSKMFISAVRTLSSMSAENWELKLNLFRKLGFSEDDIRASFRRTPQVFALSERKIKKVTEFLLSSKKVDMKFIISCPEVLIYSVERRLKPRITVLEILERKDLLSRKPSLTSIFKISEKMFQDKYVHPYSEELKKASVATLVL